MKAIQYKPINVDIESFEKCDIFLSGLPLQSKILSEDIYYNLSKSVRNLDQITNWIL